LPQKRAGSSGILLAPGLIPGIPAYSVKVHAKLPGADPAIQSLLISHDMGTGAPLAVFESSYLAALRTGVVAHSSRCPGVDFLASVRFHLKGGKRYRNLVAALSVLKMGKTRKARAGWNHF
jgi:hypothetical protein